MQTDIQYRGEGKVYLVLFSDRPCSQGKDESKGTRNEMTWLCFNRWLRMAVKSDTAGLGLTPLWMIPALHFPADALSQQLRGPAELPRGSAPSQISALLLHLLPFTRNSQWFSKPGWGSCGITVLKATKMLFVQRFRSLSPVYNT